MPTVHGRAVMVAACMAVAGCTGFGSKPEQSADPNTYPTRYRIQITKYLTLTLTDRADFRGAFIAQPALKPVGDSQRWVVCLRFTGHNQRKDKVITYYAGDVAQFIDPTPEQCGDAAYQPYQELDQMTPPE